MPDSYTLSANDCVNQDLYATAQIQGYDSDFTTVLYNFYPNQLIGNIYSWVINPKTKGVFFMFYATPEDYANFKAFYVPADGSRLSIPNYPDILQHLADMADIKARLAKMDAIDKAGGDIPYYIEKYGSWALALLIVGKVVIPALSSRKSVGAVKHKAAASPLILLLLFGGGLYAAKKWNSRKGSVIVMPLDQGTFVTPPEQIITNDLPAVNLPSAPQQLPNYRITIQ